MNAERRLQTGDGVRVLEGPFRGFTGRVTGCDPDADRLEVTVPVFGRQTAVMLERWRVEKIR